MLICRETGVTLDYSTTTAGNLACFLFFDMSTVDYTHHFNMKYFNNIDHLIVSGQLYQAAILKQFVLHDVDNTSDHDPICIHVALDVAHMSACYTP